MSAAAVSAAAAVDHQTFVTVVLMAYCSGWLLGLAVGNAARRGRRCHENTRPPQGPPPLRCPSSIPNAPLRGRPQPIDEWSELLPLPTYEDQP